MHHGASYNLPQLNARTAQMKPNNKNSELYLVFWKKERERERECEKEDNPKCQHYN